MPTPEQISNARQLALTLEKEAAEYPVYFDMRYFVASVDKLGEPIPDPNFQSKPHQQGVHPAECGTVGCAIGWAPYATGVPISAGGDWFVYAQEILGVTQSEWLWLFMNGSRPYSGTDGALAAASRLWEWIDHHESKCEGADG